VKSSRLLNITYKKDVDSLTESYTSFGSTALRQKTEAKYKRLIALLLQNVIEGTLIRPIWGAEKQLVKKSFT
jgi:hypothetical protein